MNTYTNPVHNRPCPDPYVLKHRGEYWCYCTGFWHDGRCFGILHSRDLVNWRELAGAMEPFPDGSTCYWAPEVTYDNGRFLMYYSVGNEVRMQIRVAIASHPAGPFIDSGRALTSQEFAIDPHVFVDDDGSRYMFYATDFLEHTHIGTGTVVDLMLDEFTLAGDPRPVTRARYDWQVYDPRRIEKGGVRWHTIEGPFVLKHKGLYYEMFSGGNWQNPTYGASYAIARDIRDRREWEQAADGQRVLPILRTVPGKVVGPGHNSVALGPDNRQLFCVYHFWPADGSGRVLAIDRQDWAGERMIVLGPTTTPQPAPNLPTLSDFFDGDGPAAGGLLWGYDGGDWASGGGELAQRSLDPMAAARLAVEHSSFVAEMSLRAAEPGGAGSFGVSVFAGAAEAVRLRIDGSGEGSPVICRIGQSERVVNPGQNFRPASYHLLRVEIDGPRARLSFDGRLIAEGRFEGEADSLALVTEAAAAAYSGFALTVGWEDLFAGPAEDPARSGWEASSGDWRIDERRLVQSDARAAEALIARGPALDSYEFVVNAQIDEAASGDSCCGFCPAMAGRERGPAFALRRRGERWELAIEGRAGEPSFLLPEGFDASTPQQFRFRKAGGRLLFQWEAEPLGEVAVNPGPSRIGLYARRARVSFDLATATAIVDGA